MDFVIRPATVEDTGAINDIANWYIENTAVNFDKEPWSFRKREEWIDGFNHPQCPYKMLVGITDGDIIGFACNTQFKPKAAYISSTETTVYIAHDTKSQGRGYKLYSALLDLICQENSLHRAYAFIALPNAASITLHKKLGYELVGTFDEVGTKFGKYYDCAMYQKQL